MSFYFRLYLSEFFFPFKFWFILPEIKKKEESTEKALISEQSTYEPEVHGFVNSISSLYFFLQF